MSEENSEKSALVPRLRFPEFRGAGEWEEKGLGEISTVVASGDLDAACFSPVKTDEHIYPVYSNAVEEQGLYGYYSVPKFPKNSITITARGTLGVAFARPNEFMGIGRLLVVSNFKNIDPRFICECWNHLGKVPTEVTSIPQFTAVAAKATSLPIPTSEEQQKIADCLSSLDELIAAETQKLDALKTHKKGLMQQLFPREGETVPRLRFPEFREAGEWKEIALGDVCERIMDGTHFSPASKSGPFLYLTSKNVRPGALVLDDVSYISAEEHRSIFARCPVKRNDLLLTKDGASTGNCTLNPLDFEFSLLSSVAVIRGDQKKILQEFMAQDFQSRHLQDQIADAISGQAITRITLEKIKLFKVWITSSHEQQRISDCLTSFDDLVLSQSQKIDALKAHKKGLMQQLFPVLSEAQA